MPTTFEPIATTTASGSSAVITFNSIPNTYTDLRIILTGTSSTNTGIYVQYNADTGSNYSTTQLYGDGTSAASTRQTSVTSMDIGSIWTTLPAFHQIDIFSYAGSTNKTMLHTQSGDQNGSGTIRKKVGLWRSTSAITRVDLTVYSGTFTSSTTATLFGIKAA